MLRQKRKEKEKQEEKQEEKEKEKENTAAGGQDAAGDNRNWLSVNGYVNHFPNNNKSKGL